MTVAIVVQRCHKSVVGGAEQLAWQWALMLRESFDVEVLTTTALDVASWQNVLRPGEERCDDIVIRRFSVDVGRTPYWHALHGMLLKFFEKDPGHGADASRGAQLPWRIALQEEFIRKQGPHSLHLVEHLRASAGKYRAVIFFTYLYPTTYYGIRYVPRERCLLVPALHDEPPAYLSAYRHMSRLPGLILWNSEAERRLGVRLWGDVPGRIVGTGIETRRSSPAAEAFPYLLYSGRIDAHKGCDILIDYFLRLKQAHPSDLRLILTGKNEIKLPAEGDVDYRGFVSEEEKFSLMAGALLFVMPSPYESLSISTLEAMAQGTPAAVNGASEVLVDHIDRSGGGYRYVTYEEFEAAVLQVFRDRDMRMSLGDRARQYVVGNFGYDGIRKALVEIVSEPLPQVTGKH